VGIGAAAKKTGMSKARSTSAAACAKYSLAKRRSYPTTTPREAVPRAIA
jgi:hypothetical protein